MLGANSGNLIGFDCISQISLFRDGYLLFSANFLPPLRWLLWMELQAFWKTSKRAIRWSLPLHREINNFSCLWPGVLAGSSGYLGGEVLARSAGFLGVLAGSSGFLGVLAGSAGFLGVLAGSARFLGVLAGFLFEGGGGAGGACRGPREC